MKTITGSFDQDAFPFLHLRVMNKEKALSVIEKAIIDTGAAHCLIREELAKQLELKTLRIADYRHPVYGKMELTEYIMDISFENSGETIASIEGVRAGTLIDPNYPAALILGVEVLKLCTFVYDGPNQAFTLNFAGKE